MPRIPHQAPFHNPFEDHPMHADVQRELEQHMEIHVIAARIDLHCEARAFGEQERNDPEQVNPANRNWMPFLS